MSGRRVDISLTLPQAIALSFALGNITSGSQEEIDQFFGTRSEAAAAERAGEILDRAIEEARRPRRPRRERTQP